MIFEGHLCKTTNESLLRYNTTKNITKTEYRKQKSDKYILRLRRLRGMCTGRYPLLSISSFRVLTIAFEIHSKRYSIYYYIMCFIKMFR